MEARIQGELNPFLIPPIGQLIIEYLLFQGIKAGTYDTPSHIFSAVMISDHELVYSTMENVCITNMITGQSHTIALVWPTYVCALKDGTSVFMDRQNAAINLWNHDETKCQVITCQSIKCHNINLTCFVELPYHKLAFFNTKHEIYILNIHAHYIDKLKGHFGEITSLAVTPSGVLISGSHDNTVRLWDPQRKQGQGIVLEGHTDNVVRVVALSDDIIASSSRDNTIRIWHLDKITFNPRKQKLVKYRCDVIPTGCGSDMSRLPDNRLIFNVTNDGKPKTMIWDPLDGQVRPFKRQIYKIVGPGSNNELISQHNAKIQVWV